MPEKPIFDQENPNDERGRVPESEKDIRIRDTQAAETKEDESTGFMGKIRDKAYDHPVITGTAVIGGAIGAGAAARELGPEPVKSVLEKINNEPSQAEYLAGLRQNQPNVFENVINNETIKRAGGDSEWVRLSQDEKLQRRSEVAREYSDLADTIAKRGPSLETSEEGDVTGATTTDGTQYQVDLPKE